MASEETVQLYISDLKVSVAVLNFQLINIKKVSLQPNKSTDVTFEVSPKAFDMVNNDSNRIIESGDFKIYVGGSSPMKRSFELGAPKMAEVVITVK